ncbi:hypothetical protein [Spongiactinospora sp. 9N601]|uniref:hypothetical protein n=1 Tax=Spongiactinospora sp. 9N601 TaxID=3375149 RepID=UPI00379C44E8
MTPQSDEDEVWRQIVASFNEPSADSAEDHPWPDSENLPSEPARRPLGHDGDEPGTGGDADGAAPDGDLTDAADAVDAAGAPAEDEEGHYVPPLPPPLPKADASTRIAWAALFGGPAYLLLAVLLGWELQSWALFAAVAAFVGGFVMLVVRKGDGPPGGSGWDDGAVI